MYTIFNKFHAESLGMCIPLSICFALFALACTVQEIGTRQKNQGHTKENHMKPFGGIEASYGLKLESGYHPKRTDLVKLSHT